LDSSLFVALVVHVTLHISRIKKKVVPQLYDSFLL
jgi:transcriptional regulatory protein LevR